MAVRISPAVLSFFKVINTKWTRWVFGTLVIVVLLNELLFLGFKQTFPSVEVSDYIKQQIEPHTYLSVKVEPVKLDSWRQLTFPHLRLTDPASNSPFFDLSQATLKWKPGFSQQSVSLSGQLYGGQLSGLLQAFPLGDGQLSLENVALQQVIALHHLPYVKLSGVLKNLRVKIDEAQQLMQLPQVLPTGFINASLQNLKFQFAQTLPLPIQVPEITLSDVQFVIMYGEVIEVQEAVLSGDLEGTASGTIQVDRANFLNSTATFTVKFKLSPDFKERLAKDITLNSVLSIVKCGDLIHAKLSGTLQLWNPPAKLCS